MISGYSDEVVDALLKAVDAAKTLRQTNHYKLDCVLTENKRKFDRALAHYEELTETNHE